MGADWRTWLAHFAITLAAGGLGGVALAALVFAGYVGREIGQIETELETGTPVNVADHIGDSVAPFLALVLWSIFA